MHKILVVMLTTVIMAVTASVAQAAPECKRSNAQWQMAVHDKRLKVNPILHGGVKCKAAANKFLVFTIYGPYHGYTQTVTFQYNRIVAITAVIPFRTR